jgi:L-lactate dehydrogenase complex protein LldE
MFNAGYFDQAKSVARHFLDVFSRTEGPIIAPSSSCAAMVRLHYPRLVGDDDRLEAVASRTFEFSEYLVKHLDADLDAAFKGSVTFHRSCHFRSLGMEKEPIDLIQRIKDIEYIPLEKMEQCCGFGGTFSLNFPHVSQKMAAEKVACIRRTGAEWLVFADPGCAMNILGYAHRTGAPLKAMHLAELLDRAMGG